MKYFVIILVLIVVTNLPPVKWLAGEEDIMYSNATGTFTFDELNYTGRNYQLCIDNFEAFKRIDKKDTVLYRISSKNVFKVWRWSDYLFKGKYTLPYKSWQEIESQRGPVQNKTAFQNF